MVVQGRCAVVLVYGRHLAVLPGAGSEAGELEDDDSAAAAFDQSAGIARRTAGPPAALQHSYIVDLAPLGIREVAHIARPSCPEKEAL